MRLRSWHRAARPRWRPSFCLSSSRRATYAKVQRSSVGQRSGKQALSTLQKLPRCLQGTGRQETAATAAHGALAGGCSHSLPVLLTSGALWDPAQGTPGASSPDRAWVTCSTHGCQRGADAVSHWTARGDYLQQFHAHQYRVVGRGWGLRSVTQGKGTLGICQRGKERRGQVHAGWELGS